MHPEGRRRQRDKRGVLVILAVAAELQERTTIAAELAAAELAAAESAAAELAAAELAAAELVAAELAAAGPGAVASTLGGAPVATGGAPRWIRPDVETRAPVALAAQARPQAASLAVVTLPCVRRTRVLRPERPAASRERRSRAPTSSPVTACRSR
jgi:hypothetical protein